MALDKSYLDYLKNVENILNDIKELEEAISEDKVYISDENLSKIEAIKKSFNGLKNELSNINNEIENILKGTNSSLGDSVKKLNDFDSKGIENALSKYRDYLKSMQDLSLTDEKIKELNNELYNTTDLTEVVELQEQLNVLQNSYNEKLKKTNDAKNEIISTGVELNELEDANNLLLEKELIFKDISDKCDEETKKLKEINEIISKQNDLVQKQQKDWEKIKASFKESIGLFRSGFNVIKDSTKYWREQEGAIAKVSNTLGLSKKELSQYRTFILDTTIKTQHLYGISSEGLIKLQQGYDEATNKAIKFNEEQIMAQAQLSTLMGESEAISYTSDLDKLGVGLVDARDIMEDIYKLSKSQGITSTKASQEFSKNLKLAQKYNFKGGLDNLKDMTVYAAKMKINMESIGAFADKISNPEGAIEAAARLQVLGGAFSSLSNPLSMLYESLEDVGGLGERVGEMFGDIGRFDTELGEVRINGMDRMRVKAAAEAMGMSYEEALNIVRERAKRNKIYQDVSFNPNLDQEQKDLIATLAQFNKKTGQFEVSTFNEDTQRFESKSVAEISPEDINKLRGDEESLDAITENVFGINAKFDKLLGSINASKAVQQEKLFGDKTRNVLEKTSEIIVNNSSVIGKVATGYGLITAAIITGNALLKAILSVINMKNVKITGKDGVLNTGVLKNKGWGGSPLLSGKNFLRGAGVTAVGAVGAYGLGKWSDNLNEKGNTEGAAWASLGSNILGFASSGAMFGPWGVAIGGIIGAIVGITSNLDELISSVTNFYDNTIKPLFNKIGEFFTGIWDKGKNFFSGLFSSKNNDEDVVRVNDAISENKHIISDPKDSIMFAKEGGPFDKMFNNIIPKVNNLYNTFGVDRSNLREFYSQNDKVIKSIEKVAQNSSISSNDMYYTNNVKPIPIGDTKSYFKEIKETNKLVDKTNNNSVLFEKPLEIKINGTLRLENNNGNSVDLISMVKNNPILLKELTKMISDEISSSINGGRVDRNNNFSKI